MEVLLLIAVLVMGASVLYVAVTLNSRTQHATNPGIQQAQQIITQDITSKLGDVDKALRDQLQGIDHTLASSYALVEQMQRRLARADTQISELSSQLAAERSDVKRLGDYVARLSESVAQQSTRLSGIENYIASRNGLAAADISQLQESLNDLGERQSKTHAELVEFTSALKRLMATGSQRGDSDRQGAEQKLDRPQSWPAE